MGSLASATGHLAVSLRVAWIQDKIVRDNKDKYEVGRGKRKVEM